jgi:hypothetical protein
MRYPVRHGFSVLSLTSLEYWIAYRSLSSGGHSADPLAGDDDWGRYASVASRRHAPELCVNLSPYENRGCSSRFQGIKASKMSRFHACWLLSNAAKS